MLRPLFVKTVSPGTQHLIICTGTLQPRSTRHYPYTLNRRPILRFSCICSLEIPDMQRQTVDLRFCARILQATYHHASRSEARHDCSTVHAGQDTGSWPPCHSSQKITSLGYYVLSSCILLLVDEIRTWSVCTTSNGLSF